MVIFSFFVWRYVPCLDFSNSFVSLCRYVLIWFVGIDDLKMCRHLLFFVQSVCDAISGRVVRWWIEGYTLRLLRYHKINYRRRRGYITDSLQNNSRVLIKHKWSPGCFPVIEYATIPYISQYLKTSISYKDWRMTNSTYNVYVTHFHKSDFLHLEGICFAISNEVFWFPPEELCTRFADFMV